VKVETTPTEMTTLDTPRPVLHQEVRLPLLRQALRQKLRVPSPQQAWERSSEVWELWRLA